ncbi:MAG: response regulator transcription factor [Acidobacteria bacterium]|nr:response regulator transcription factor [Acidobacteriota bacterium]
MNFSPPLRALVADDEYYARQRVIQLLDGVPDFHVIAESENGHQAVEGIREHHPDVVFLDIQMPELDGFGVLETIGSDKMPPTVFTTAFNQHAIHAFECNALDYLLKPIDPDRLHLALERVRNWHRKAKANDVQAQLESLLAMVRQEEAHLKRILVKQDDHHIILKTSGIQWIEAEDNYVRLHVEGTSHLLRMSMTSLLSRLDPEVFRRIHRSSIVNLDFVREVHPWFSGDHILIMKDGTKLTMSRTYREQLKELV